MQPSPTQPPPNITLERTSSSARWTEDLPALAAEAYALAPHFCSSCLDYHALWPYRRITLKHHEAVGGHSPVESAIAELIAAGSKRVMIAGAADTGVLATLARATRGKAVWLCVVDICGTPLELCRRFARHWSLPLETTRADLLKLGMVSAVDIVYANSIVQFVPPERRLDLFLRIARALSPGGHFVQTFTVGRRMTHAERHEYTEVYCQGMLDELVRRGVTIPDAYDVFRRRLIAFAREGATRQSVFEGPDSVRWLLKSAGFVTKRLEPLAVEITSPHQHYLKKLGKQRFLAVAERL
jgi:hypothetical protein